MMLTRSGFFKAILAAILGSKNWTKIRNWLKPSIVELETRYYSPKTIALIRRTMLDYKT